MNVSPLWAVVCTSVKKWAPNIVVVTSFFSADVIASSLPHMSENPQFTGTITTSLTVNGVYEYNSGFDAYVLLDQTAANNAVDIDVEATDSSTSIIVGDGDYTPSAFTGSRALQAGETYSNIASHFGIKGGADSGAVLGHVVHDIDYNFMSLSLNALAISMTYEYSYETDVSYLGPEIGGYGSATNTAQLHLLGSGTNVWAETFPGLAVTPFLDINETANVSNAPYSGSGVLNYWLFLSQLDQMESLFTYSDVAGDSVISLPAAVPVPSAVWLFGSGLIGLISIARRKNAA